ncbi:hypothetical protein K1719_012871 [Acacia pycnantha]|nr:hypothetical protein K1719_012871 [Acacia pycnantha]
MSPASRSKSRDKRAVKEAQKAFARPIGSVNMGAAIPTNAYNPLFETESHSTLAIADTPPRRTIRDRVQAEVYMAHAEAPKNRFASLQWDNLDIDDRISLLLFERNTTQSKLSTLGANDPCLHLDSTEDNTAGFRTAVWMILIAIKQLFSYFPGNTVLLDEDTNKEVVQSVARESTTEQNFHDSCCLFLLNGSEELSVEIHLHYKMRHELSQLLCLRKIQSHESEKLQLLYLTISAEANLGKVLQAPMRRGAISDDDNRSGRVMDSFDQTWGYLRERERDGWTSEAQIVLFGSSIVELSFSHQGWGSILTHLYLAE